MSDQEKFAKMREKDLKEIYGSSETANNKYNRSLSFGAREYENAKQIRALLDKGIGARNELVNLSKKVYAINPIYAALISYYSDMFLWRYTLVPHKLPKFNTHIAAFRVKKKDYNDIYQAMLEIAEGLHLEKKGPLILRQLFLEGAAFFTTYADEESLAIDTILFPSKYCRKIAETQFGTAVIQLDYTYFNSLGLDDDELNDLLNSFPEEIREGYFKYQNSATDERWQTLDPHYSSCITLNEYNIPSLIYTYGSLLNYEQYGDNELKRNANKLKYIVTHKMPIYQDTLIFDTNEVKTIHKSLSKIVNTSEDARLMTTYGDIDVKKIQGSENTENKTLLSAYESIFNNSGLNASIFSGESVTSLKYSVIRDKAQVWTFIEELNTFYNMTINNWFDFDSYQMDIDILPICQYTYNEDMERYKEQATLGVGKLDFIVATGIKQKHIQDRFILEDFLKLDQIKPLQSSYTQTGKESSSTGDSGSKNDKNNNVEKDTKDTEQSNKPSPDVAGNKDNNVKNEEANEEN